MKRILFSLFILVSILGYSQTYQKPLYDDNGKVILTSDGTKVLTTEGLPNDGFNYTPNPEWIPVNGVTDGEIWILAYTGGSSNLLTITCTTNSGEWEMDIYGGADGKTLLRTYDTTSNVALSHTLLTNAGRYCSSGGYYTYKILIKPKTVGGKLLTISSTTNNSPYIIINNNAQSIKSIIFGGSENLLYSNFYNCSNITGLSKSYEYCTSLKKLTFPTSCLQLKSVQEICIGCTSLLNIVFPKYAPQMNSITRFLEGCTSLKSVTLPSLLPDVSSGRSFLNDLNLTSILGNTIIGPLGFFNENLNGCNKLDTIQLIYPANSIIFRNIILAIDTFNQPTLRTNSFLLTGTSNAIRSNIAYINIDWANSNFGGTGNIDIRYNSLSATELDRIFTALPTVTGTHVINVASNIGAASLTPSQIEIATDKGWTVTIS